MLKVDTDMWEQMPQLLRQIGLQDNHPRTRERLMALYEITQGKMPRKWHDKHSEILKQ